VIRAQEMPWEWFTGVREATGPKQRYELKVNGRVFLVGRAGSAASMVRSVLQQIPAGARVQVRRLSGRNPVKTGLLAR
jgi:hypothetical protein